MPASRGFISRAASALLFAGAAAMLLAFPGAAAENDNANAAPAPAFFTTANPTGLPDGIEVAQVAGVPEIADGGAAFPDALPPSIPADGNVPETRESCEALLGDFNPTGNGFCLDIAAATTPFCEIGSGCQVLMNRVRDCNEMFNQRGGGFRPATRTSCGAVCEYGLTAFGNKCVSEMGGDLTPNLDMAELPDGIPADGNVPETRESCEALLGDFNPTGNGFCLDIAAATTPFCEIGSGCQVLMNRVRDCNLMFNQRGGGFRPATKTSCGAKCDYGTVARGNKCVAPSGPMVEPTHPCGGQGQGICEEFVLTFSSNLDGGGISVFAADGAVLTSGATVTQSQLLTATAYPDLGRYVSGWTGCDDGDSDVGSDADRTPKNCVFYMPASNWNVGASFTAAQEVLRYTAQSFDPANNNALAGVLSAVSEGKDVANGTLLNFGVQVTLTALPIGSYFVEAWTGPCRNGVGEVGAEGEQDKTKQCVISITPGQGNIAAVFVKEPEVALPPTTDVIPPEVLPPPPPGEDPVVPSIVVVTLSPEGVPITVTLSPDVETNIPAGNTLAIKFPPVPNYCIDRWTGACEEVGETGCVGEDDEEKQCELVVTDEIADDLANGRIYPIWVPRPTLYQITHSPTGGGVVSLHSERALPVEGYAPGDFPNGGRIYKGGRVEFTAIPNSGYYVERWTGVCSGSVPGSADDGTPKTCDWFPRRDLTGEVIVRFGRMPLTPFTPEERVAALPENRQAVYAAVENFTGIVATITARTPGVSLVFLPSAGDGLAVNRDGVLRVRAPLIQTFLHQFTATVASDSQEPERVLLQARVDPVYHPGPPAPIVVETGGNFPDRPQTKPSGYATGGTFTEVGATPFDVDADDGAISASPFPPAGEYTVAIDFTHPEFVGALRYETPIRIITAETGVPSARLNPGRIYVAQTLPSRSEFYRLSADGSNIILTNRSPGTAVNRIRATQDGEDIYFSVSNTPLDTNVYSATFEMDEWNTQTNQQVRRLTVDIAFQRMSTDRNAVVTIVVTGGTPAAAEGAFLGLIRVIPADGANPPIPGFNAVSVSVPSNVQPLTNRNLTLAGMFNHELRAGANLTANASQNNNQIYALSNLPVTARDGSFVGTHQVRFRVEVVTPPPDPLAPDTIFEDVSVDSPIVHVAPGYSGFGVEISLKALSRFTTAPNHYDGDSDSSNDLFAVEYDETESDARFRSILLTMMGDTELRTGVRFAVSCVSPRRCAPTSLPFRSANPFYITYRPIRSEVQPEGRVPVGTRVQRAAVPPIGFEGGIFRELTVAYPDPAHETLFDVSESGVLSDTLTGNSYLPLGFYQIPVSYEIPGVSALDGAGGFLGTLMFTMTVEVVKLDLPVNQGLDGTDIRPSVIAVAPHSFSGIFTTLELRGDDVGLAGTGQGSNDIFAWGQNGRAVEFSLPNPLGSSEVVGRRITLLQVFSSRPDDYFSRTAVVRLSVRGVTVEVPLIGGPGSTIVQPFSSDNLIELSGVDGAFGNATFAQVGGATGLNLNGSVISTDGELTSGDYQMVLDVSGPQFRGVARMTISVNVQDKLPVPAEDGIPEANRLLLIYPANGYQGELASITPANPLVVFHTPNTNPPGLSLPTNQRFAGTGFKISLAAQVPANYQLDTSFVVTAELTERSLTPITVSVRVRGIDAPLLNPRNVVYGVGAILSELYPPTRVPGGNFRIVGVDANYDGSGGVSADATTDFIVNANNELVYAPTAPLAVGGQYRVRAGYTASRHAGNAFLQCAG